MTKREERTVPCCIDVNTSKLDEFLLKQNKRIQQIKDKLRKASQAQEREHLKIVYRAEQQGEADMKDLTPKYKFKLYTFKKKSRTKIADRKAVKRRADFTLHRTESWLTPARIALFKSMMFNALLEEEYGNKY